MASDKRAPGFPDVPTSIEGGVPTYQVATWYGLWAPKGTPKELVAAMQAELKKAFATDEIKSAWNGLGTNVPAVWGDDFGKFVASETKRRTEVVKSSGAKVYRAAPGQAMGVCSKRTPTVSRGWSSRIRASSMH